MAKGLDLKPFYWCPACHRRIATPPMLLGGKITLLGKIKIRCGHCPRGVVEFAFTPAVAAPSKAAETSGAA